MSHIVRNLDVIVEGALRPLPARFEFDPARPLEVKLHFGAIYVYHGFTTEPTTWTFALDLLETAAENGKAGSSGGHIKIKYYKRKEYYVFHLTPSEFNTASVRVPSESLDWFLSRVREHLSALDTDRIIEKAVDKWVAEVLARG